MGKNWILQLIDKQLKFVEDSDDEYNEIAMGLFKNEEFKLTFHNISPDRVYLQEVENDLKNGGKDIVINTLKEIMYQISKTI